MKMTQTAACLEHQTVVKSLAVISWLLRKENLRFTRSESDWLGWKFLFNLGLPNPWRAGHICPAKMFCVARKVFLRGGFPHGKAYLAFSGK